jgi:hypothetical protein
LKCIHIEPSGYHSNFYFLKITVTVFLPGKDLGQGHSQNNQSFGLGGPLILGMPLPWGFTPQHRDMATPSSVPSPLICISMSENLTSPSGFVGSF